MYSVRITSDFSKERKADWTLWRNCYLLGKPDGSKTYVSSSRCNLLSIAKCGSGKGGILSLWFFIFIFVRIFIPSIVSFFIWSLLLKMSRARKNYFNWKITEDLLESWTIIGKITIVYGFPQPSCLPVLTTLLPLMPAAVLTSWNSKYFYPIYLTMVCFRYIFYLINSKIFM